jgi:O-antigen ligase
LPAFGVVMAALGAAALLGMLAALSGEVAMLFGVVALLAAAVLLLHRFGVWWMCLLFPLAQTALVPRQLMGVTGMNPVNILTAATVASLLLAWLGAKFSHRVQGLPPAPKPLLWLYVLPIGLAALHGFPSVERIPEYYHQIRAIAFDDGPAYLRDVFMRPMFLVLFALLVALVFRDAPNPRIYLVPVLLSALGLCGLVAYVLAESGLSLSVLGSTRARGVLSGIGMHANEISLLLNTALALTLFTLRGARGFVWLALAFCAVVFGSTVLLTFSRGGFLGLLVVFVAYMLHADSPRSALAAVALGVAVAFALPDAVVERASTGVAAGDRSAISAGRADAIWPNVIPVVFDAPLFGGGLMSILWSPPARSGVISVAQTHNAYLGLVLDMGLLGFASVMAFFAWAWMQVRAASREAADPFYQHFFAGAAVTIPLLFAQGISDDRFTPTTTQTLMWFGIGAALGYRARTARSPQTVVTEAPARRRVP